jgi:hypothetical protein
LKNSIFWDIAPRSPVKVDPTFWRNISLPSSGMRSNWNLLPVHAGFFLALLLHSKDGGDSVLWNVSWLSQEYTALYPKRKNSSLQLSWELQIHHHLHSLPTTGDTKLNSVALVRERTIPTDCCSLAKLVPTFWG